jgi:hypothetical protein
VRGQVGTDTICIEKGICAENVSMLIIEESWDLKGLYADGILGLAPTSQRGNADLVVQKLWE